MDEVRFNQEQEFTNWSSQLFDAISSKTETDKATLAKNKLLGYQDFDFNLLHTPFKLSFTDKTLELEPCVYLICHYPSLALSSSVT